MDRPPVWRWLRALPHVTLEFHDEGPRGRVSHRRQVISLRSNLTAAGRRDALLHELLHLHRGPVPRGLKAKEEEQVRRRTARYLLPDLGELAEALAWATHPAEAADELGISVQVLTKRLQHLHPAERGHLLRRLEHQDGC